MNFALLMPAAGSGARLGSHIPKTLLEIAGKPLFVHAAEPLVRHASCIEAVIAAPAGYESQYAAAVAREWAGGTVRVVTGGATRQESVSLALHALRKESDAVLIHDAARPFLKAELIKRVFEALAGNVVGALPGIPVTDTIKRVADSYVVETLNRAELMAVQTPQALRRSVALQAHRLASQDAFDGTDDVALVERYGLGSVRVVEGDPRNFKVTTPEDLARARELLEHLTYGTAR